MAALKQELTLQELTNEVALLITRARGLPTILPCSAAFCFLCYNIILFFSLRLKEAFHDQLKQQH